MKKKKTTTNEKGLKNDNDDETSLKPAIFINSYKTKQI